MKRLAIILVGLLIGMVSIGQTVSEKSGSVTQVLDAPNGVTYWYSGTDADIVTQADTLVAYTFGVKSLDALKQYVMVTLTENSGASGIVVSLLGKEFWDQSYTSITSATYHGGGSDTTILLDGSSAKHDRFYKILIDGVSDSTFNTTVNKIELQVYK